MKLGLLIFLLAFIIRIINLFFLNLDPNTYLIEDQKFYWEWSLKGAYLPWSELTSMTLSERMPGSFLFIGFLQWLTNNNLFLILSLQSIIDSFTCVIIFGCASLINKRYKLYVGIFAACSPLMIIISSQILSDTIFLFTFSATLYLLLKFFNSNHSSHYLFLSGLFLGISTFIRAATFPLIFLGLPVIFLILKKKKIPNKKALISLSLFFFISLLPISHRWINNIILHDSYALTSQSGSHMAYWMVPGVLSVSKDFDREAAISFVNDKIYKRGGFSGDSYQNSKLMLEVSKDIFSKEPLLDISYAWLRSSILNIIVSPILIDHRVRNLEHPSFSRTGNIIKWLKKLTINQKNILYINILIISLIFTTFSCISFVIGFYIFFKTNMILSVASLFIIAYFCLITGPTISPKYCLPFLPIIFYFQAISLDKLLLFIKHR